jgi:multidrug resistance efflux pump
MQRRFAIPAVIVVALVAGGVFYVQHDSAPPHYTGFVEGEERVIRSEMMGRVLDVAYPEGAAVPANAVVATLDDRDIQARIASKQQEISVLDADLRTQEERVQLVESTWQRDLNARTAEVEQAQAAADLAEHTLAREQELTRRGVASKQSLDDHRARRDEARSALERAGEMHARAEAEERTIAMARYELASLREKRELALAQLAELQVAQSKYLIHAPAVATTVLTQFIWPGELAQPGSAIVSALDPKDKYVQIYVPVADVARLRVGQRVEIELDSEPGHRVPGEVSFVADKANFTPEKIETRSDRMGQVYRAKVRILDGVERFQPGTEGNVYLVTERDGRK